MEVVPEGALTVIVSGVRDFVSAQLLAAVGLGLELKYAVREEAAISSGLRKEVTSGKRNEITFSLTDSIHLQTHPRFSLIRTELLRWGKQ